MKKLFFGLSLASVLLLAGCWGGNKDEATPAEEKMQPGEKMLVVNVLDPELYEDAHIKGSINVPFDQLDEFLKKTDKNTELVFYCANYACSASGASAEQAKVEGFANARAYEGGTAEWVNLGYPHDGPATQDYIHGDNPKPDHLADYAISAEELKQKMVENKLI